ncbi:hypothetical protein N7462_001584 [Penicillium macrosclerotiorum]|uniref:uncharacterized protein n=1 Tax=Penicillium macrosclerotiorum TaxID=303699 RepID=UPI0025481876|nr:uncharacterized protein N7462_001584 [Penicillium macrosclerotiorum]KAJ5692161.1 hypothetical protein N7462_001584 [Penicillium macrosclerotiorum]
MEEYFASLPNPFPREFYEASSIEEKATEALWWNSVRHLDNTNNEVLIPDNVVPRIGQNGFKEILSRLSKLLDCSIDVIYDDTVSAWRMMPRQPPRFMPFDAGIHQLIRRELELAVMSGVKIPESPRRIPRPRNQFIIYRQHHHHEVTAQNPGVQNTEICKMWRNEQPAVRETFKRLALEEKQKHAAEHPNYQYTPRRPAEVPRRKGKIHANYLQFLNNVHGGPQRLQEAMNETDGFVEVDNDLVDLLAMADVLYGPNGVAPIPGPIDDDEFQRIVNMQLERQAIETLNFVPLAGDEFDTDFNMDELLNL